MLSSCGSDIELLAADVEATSGSDTCLEGTKTPPGNYIIGVTQSKSHTTSHTTSVTCHTASVTPSLSHSGEATSVCQVTAEDVEVRDLLIKEIVATKAHKMLKPVTTSVKRPHSDVGHDSSSSSEECSFFVSKSTKNRGRPKIRKVRSNK